MPRPRSFDTDAIIDQLCDYFWEHGYSAASLDDLAQRLGVKRGSLFNAFGSKEVLFTAAFDRYSQRCRIVFNTRHQGRKAIEDYFHQAILFQRGSANAIATDRGMGRGCFFINLLMAAEIPTPELQQAIDRDVIFLKNFLTEHLNRARLDNELLPTVSISTGVDALFGTIVGLSALARTNAAPSEIEAFVNNNLRGLFGLELLV
jgi:TetR/AcrR family transcriptional regulator, transcriptional repressor for nem operon